MEHKEKKYKEDVTYKLMGYQPVGIDYTIPREELAYYKNGSWYPIGYRKELRNFVIEQIIEL